MFAYKKLASTVLWRIENLRTWDSKLDRPIAYSPEFMLHNLSENKCTLRMSLRISLELNFYFFSSSKKHYFNAEFEWSILDRDGLPIPTETDKYYSPISQNPKRKPNSLSLEKIFGNENSAFLPNGDLTLQLRISPHDADKNFDKAEHITIVTRMKAVEESFVWNVAGFNSIQLDEEAVTSVKLGKDFFELIFFLRGTSLEDADVSFRIVAGNTQEQRIGVKLCLLDKDEKEAMRVEDTQAFSSSIPEQIWVVPKLFSRREILERSHDLLHGEDLKCLCKFTTDLNYKTIGYVEKYYCGPSNLSETIQGNDGNVPRRTAQNARTFVSTISKINVQTSLKSLNQQRSSKKISLSNTILGEDLVSVYNEQILSDFELRSGDVSFPVHKIVLSARSPVFKAMFCGDMKESSSKSMDVPDLDVHTLGRMLTFVYSGTVDDLEWDSAARLYYAADKYEMLSLKQQCSDFLQSNLTVSNVSDILELADRHQDLELVSHVHEFIGDNFEEVIASDEWCRFLERGCLAGKTMKEVLLKNRQGK